MSIQRSLTNGNGLIGSRSKPGRILRRARLPLNLGMSRRRFAATLVALSVVAIVAITVVPVARTSAFPDREGGLCSTAYGGCHSGAQTPAMLTVSGLPAGSYVPGQQYTISITITDSNGAGTGENNFDIIATAGVFSNPDANTEINSLTEASANTTANHATLTTGSVVWTAPTSGSVTISIWAVMGDGLAGTLDIWDLKTYTDTAIPEFSFVILPVVGVIGALIFASKISKKHK